MEGKMTGFEIKKVFSRTGNKMALLILIMLLFLVSYLAIGSVEFVDEQGNSSSGIAAARLLREEKNKWAGEITQDVLEKVILQDRKINATKEYLSLDYRENNKAYAKKQGFSDIREILNMAFSSFREYDYYKINSIQVQEAGTLYERRISNLTDWLYGEEAKDRYTKEQKEYILRKYRELPTPLYYEYADGWKALLEYAPTVIMLTLLILGFPISGIFANEFQLKADSIFFSAEFGRNKAVRAKISAGLLIITGIYWGMMFLYSAVMLFVLGTDGAGCMIQTGLGGFKSFYNLTYFQTYLLTVAGGYLGCLFILLLVMLVSAKTHSTILSVTVPFILLFIPSFLSDISVLSKALGILPDQLLQVSQAVRMFQLYQIGGRVTGAVPVIMILYPVLSCILVPALYRIYSRA